jgi:hypothetical protein
LKYSFRTNLVCLLLFKVFLISSTLVSCNLPFFDKKAATEGTILVKAYGKYLTTDQLRQFVPEGTSQDDSVQMAKSFIDNWIRQQVIMNLAENNLPDRMKQVEKQLEEYRNSLITYIYETELINQRLDTLVSDLEIEKYYNENPRNFELKDNIVKTVYVKVKQEAPKLDKMRVWFKSGNERDRQLLTEYCYQFAADFRFDEENWMLFDELLKTVPIKTYDQEHFLRNNRLIEFSDSNYIYLIKILDFKIRESLSPLAFEKENVKALILNKRKLELIKQMETDAIS